MCDYSLEMAKSREAADNEDLILKAFRTGSKGFVDPSDEECAVCLKEGTELTLNVAGVEMKATFAKRLPAFGYGYKDGVIMPDGDFRSLQEFAPGTKATVVKALPAEITEAAKGSVAFDPDEATVKVAETV